MLSLSLITIPVPFSAISKSPFDEVVIIDILHHLVPLKSVRLIAKVITRTILKNADQVLVYTKFHENLFINEGCHKHKVKILPNGISIENTYIDLIKIEKLRKSFSIEKDDFVLFFMGYLYEFAGLKEIIEYYNDDVSNNKINYKFIIVGDGGIYSQLKKYVKDLKAYWVYLTGRVPYFEIAEYIALSDLCLLSFQINDITKKITPIKVLEYMAMKKPVLSTKLPGLFIEMGENHGIIFAKDQRELITKIGRLVVKKENLQKIGLKGHSLVMKKYTWKSILNNFKEFIILLINE